MYYYTGSNNSTFLQRRRAARTMRQATREALQYLRGELMYDGCVSIYDTDEWDAFPVLTFERSIHTGYRCIRTDQKTGASRVISL